MELNIEQILQSEQAWEYILLDIVRSEELDPWDIDLTKLTESYLTKIKKMKELDLRVPARIILAAAVLLKLQADTMLPSGTDELFEDMLEGETDLFLGEEEEKEDEEVPLLDLRVRRKPSRKITLDDLVNSLKKSMKSEVRQKQKRVRFQLNIDGVDITQQIEDLHKKIHSRKESCIPFSTLLKDKDRDSVINTFLPILHLANDHKIGLKQKDFFKEFYILKQATPNT